MVPHHGGSRYQTHLPWRWKMLVVVLASGESKVRTTALKCRNQSYGLTVMSGWVALASMTLGDNE